MPHGTKKMAQNSTGILAQKLKGLILFPGILGSTSTDFGGMTANGKLL